MSRRPVRKPTLHLLSLDERITPDASPGIRQNYFFDGPTYAINPPPATVPAVAASPGIAVGPTHTVTITNNQIQWRTIPNGTATTTNLGAFFSHGFGGNPIVWSGAEAIFDPVGQRFVVAAAVRANSTTESKIMLAVSKTANPSTVNGWFFQFIPANVGTIGTSNYAADIGLAVDEEALYVTSGHYAFSSNLYQDVRVHVLNKAQLYNQQTTDRTTVDPSPSGQEAAYRYLQPAQVYGDPPTGSTGTYFVAYTGVSGGADFATVARINNPLTTPTFTANTVNVGDIDQGGALPDAPQSGSPIAIDTGDREVGNAVWQNNRLYFASTINPVGGAEANQATAHWFIVNTTNNSVADQGDAPGTAGLHTFFPTVAVDLDGSLAVTYSGSEGGRHGQGVLRGPAVRRPRRDDPRPGRDQPGPDARRHVRQPGRDDQHLGPVHVDRPGPGRPRVLRLRRLRHQPGLRDREQPGPVGHQGGRVLVQLGPGGHPRRRPLDAQRGRGLGGRRTGPRSGVQRLRRPGGGGPRRPARLRGRGQFEPGPGVRRPDGPSRTSSR